MRAVLALALFSLSLEAVACSCAVPVRTLEERVDAAERVVVVRVVRAELVGESAQAATRGLDADPHGAQVAYGVRTLAVLKGSEASLPPLTGGANVWNGGCNDRLEVGQDLLVFIERGENALVFNTCSALQQIERLDDYPEAEPRLQAIADYVRLSEPITACLNDPSYEFDHADECRAQHREAVEDYRRTYSREG